MAFHNKEFTIKDSKDPKIARFFVAYPNKAGMSKSLQLLSSFKQQRNLFLEFDSAFTNLPTTAEIQTAAKDFLNNLQQMGIRFLHQTSEVKDTRGLLGILNLNKTFTSYHIFAFIPDQIWQDDAFQAIIPRYGARYYVYKDGVDIDEGKMLEELLMGRIPEDKMLELFDFIIYDCMEFGQMGVKTVFSKEELQMRLPK